MLVNACPSQTVLSAYLFVFEAYVENGLRATCKCCFPYMDLNSLIFLAPVCLVFIWTKL